MPSCNMERGTAYVWSALRWQPNRRNNGGYDG